MSLKRKICVITGTRAEYGLLRGLMTEITNDEDLELQVIATGTHLSPEFGLTYRSIEQDGFIINEKIEMLLSSDTSVGMGKSLGLAVLGFVAALDRLQPEIMVILGDRYEIFAAAQAAMVLRIPIAHLAGGETTEGAIDEAIRHSITKMAHLHFVAAEEYGCRVIQLGENPGNVYNFGHPGLENIKKAAFLTCEQLEESIGFNLGKKYLLVTYHPTTLSELSSRVTVNELFVALDKFPDIKVLITKPNADAASREIIQSIDNYAAGQPDRVYATTSLGQQRYLSAMKYCLAVVGNSSSGIVEAPALKRATVNIGDRQLGRLKADSIVDCSEQNESISAAIKRVLSPEFQAELPYVKSLYGEGDTARLIKECLKYQDLQGILMKKFYDLQKTLWSD